MTTKSAFSVLGLAHKFGLAWEKSGGSVEELNALAEDGEKLKQALSVLRGAATACPVLLDCGIAPYVPDGWTVEEHRNCGLLDLANAKIDLFRDEGQMSRNGMAGEALRKALAGQPVLNAVVLDYLLEHPSLIPAEWRGVCVFFWGTIYRDSEGGLRVRYLSWSMGDKWTWSSNLAGYPWSPISPAARAQTDI